MYYCAVILVIVIFGGQPLNASDDCCCLPKKQMQQPQLSIPVSEVDDGMLASLTSPRGNRQSPSTARARRGSQIVRVLSKKGNVSPNISTARQKSRESKSPTRDGKSSSPNRYRADTPTPMSPHATIRHPKRSAVVDMVTQIDPSTATTPEQRDAFLRLAVMAQQAQAVHDLLVDGANPYAVDRDGKSAIGVAAEKKDTEMMELCARAAHLHAARPELRNS